MVATTAPPQANDLGILPSTVNLLDRSGLALAGPAGAALVTRRQALVVAGRQGRQDVPQAVFLADVSQPAGGAVGAQPRLCWVVLLRPSPDALGNLPAPGRIDLYAVLVDAHSGSFLEGVIAFRGASHSGVGSE